MGIRETLNKNPAITTGATIGIIVLAFVFIIWEVVGSGSGSPRIPTKAYYTVDDGATYFADDINLLAPFDHDGKKAVKCNVFKCASGKPFVAYLEKYSDEARAAIEKARAKTSNGAPDPMAIDQAMMGGLLVKAPLTGDKGWLRQDMKGAEKVTEIKCPDGGSLETLEPVLP